MPSEREWAKIRKQKQENIERAINQREKSIAFFNSVNSAIQITEKSLKSPARVKKDLICWRDWFYEQWQEWYLNNLPVPKLPAYVKKAFKQEDQVDELKKEETGEINEVNRELEGVSDENLKPL